MTTPALADVLDARPTITVGQADSLKLDTGSLRVWLSRCGVEDGEPFPNTVTIEAASYANHDARDWVELCRLDGDNATTEAHELARSLRQYLGADISEELAHIISEELRP